ncbi:MAG TPA: glycine/betaine/sarcosine/D-proline family reductase selenoprotein B, partial [Acidimicrobiia bacterium]|nr:glycine/betaine/sarcosine/D-proline family reductase selenoprotein B [Acidimicrobiia bacterium]
AGIGGEEKAWVPAGMVDGPLGPGRRLATLLGTDFEIVGTVFCGDDYAAGDGDGVVEQIVALATKVKPDLVVAGPAFGSGRYGLACARVAAAATAAGIAAVAAMHEDNPGVEDAGAAPVVAAGATARDMKPSLERLAAAAHTVAAGGALTAADGRVGPVPRRGTLAEAPAAVRAVDLLLARLAGDRQRSEVPLPNFDRVTPAPPRPGPASPRRRERRSAPSRRRLLRLRNRRRRTRFRRSRSRLRAAWRAAVRAPTVRRPCRGGPRPSPRHRSRRRTG